MAKLTKRHLDQDARDFNRLLVISDNLLRLSKKSPVSARGVRKASDEIFSIVSDLLERDAKAEMNRKAKS